MILFLSYILLVILAHCELHVMFLSRLFLGELIAWLKASKYGLGKCVIVWASDVVSLIRGTWGLYQHLVSVQPTISRTHVKWQP